MPLWAHPQGAWPADCWEVGRASCPPQAHKDLKQSGSHVVGAQRLTRKRMCGVPGMRTNVAD